MTITAESSSLLIVAILVAPVTVHAQDAREPNEEAIHEALRELRDESLAALEGGNFDALFQNVHENVVITVENGTVVRGIDELRSFYEETMGGPDSPLEGFSVSEFESDELSILYGGDTALAWGSANLEYRPRNGEPLREAARWSALLVRHDEQDSGGDRRGRWLIANLHTSVDFTSSAYLDLVVSKSVTWAVAGTAVAALLVGLLAGFLLGRRRSAAR